MEKSQCHSNPQEKKKKIGRVNKSYQPVTLLSICRKIQNGLLSSNQSDFRPGDSCINQLLSITQETRQCFDNGLELRGLLLDMLKAFDKV